MLNGAEYGPYRTHEPVLAAVVAATAGDVLEIGAGTFSTPLLHAICAAMGRRLVTVDNDAGWIDKFGSLASGTHSLHAVASWTDALPLFASSWGVAFVDHAPIERRIVDIEFLSRRCDALVVHDSEDPDGVAVSEEAIGSNGPDEQAIQRPHHQAALVGTLRAGEDRGVELVDRHLGSGQALELGHAADMVHVGVGDNDVAQVVWASAELGD